MIDTNKAREYAELLLLFEGQPSADELKINAGRMLLALADAHDSMAKNDARYRWLRQPDPLKRAAHIAVLTHNGGWVASGEQADTAIDAAMGSDNG